MPKFYLECENWDGFKNTAEFEADFLEDIKENIDLFLKGAGFAIDEEEKSSDVFSHIVNDLSSNSISMDKIEGDLFILKDDPVCPVCKLPADIMNRDVCFDPDCGLKTNAN
jgi:hypothetical protein